MIKKFTLSILSLIMATLAMAHELGPDEALSKALQRLGAKQSQTHAAKAARTKASDIKLAFTQLSQEQKPLLYAYDLPGGGFVIAAADDRAKSLLGYADEGSFLEEEQNPGFAQWKQQCTEALEWLSRQPELTSRNQHRDTERLTPVAPLLGSIKWGQFYPYNAMCPYRTNEKGDQVQAPTGCVAIATAQIMMYHQWPLTGTGQHTNKNDSTQTVDFSQSTYDWGSLKAAYTGKENAEDATPIAKLMYDIGCAEDMQYKHNESSGHISNAMYALSTYFKYDKGITLLFRLSHTTKEWNQIMREELNQQRPIYFSAGTSLGQGHAFVIDGYDENGLYHVNWGFNGDCNGYFDMDYLDPDVQGIGGGNGSYNISQAAITNIQRDETGTSQAKSRLEIVIPLCQYFDCLQYTFANYGIGDFTGSVGIRVQNHEGKIVHEQFDDFSDDPIPFDTNVLFKFKIPTELQNTEGLVARPIYNEGGTVSYYDRQPLSAGNSLVSHDSGYGIEWNESEENSPMLLIKDWKMVRNYVGYAPKIQLSITNLPSSDVEYNDKVVVAIINDTQYFCFGEKQLFLQPGETKTIEVDCKKDGRGTVADLQAGNYYFVPEYYYGNQEVYFCYETDDDIFIGEEFSMIESAPSNISYSDFSIDKTEVEQGDLLTASFNVDNTGGYALKDYYFCIFREGETRLFNYIKKRDNDIAPYTQSVITITGPIHFDPGHYYGVFYDNSEKKWISEKLWFTVADKNAPTGVVSPSADNDSQSSTVYDLFGRRIANASRHGIYIVGGKKIVK